MLKRYVAAVLAVCLAGAVLTGCRAGGHKEAPVQAPAGGAEIDEGAEPAGEKATLQAYQGG